MLPTTKQPCFQSTRCILFFMKQRNTYMNNLDRQERNCYYSSTSTYTNFRSRPRVWVVKERQLMAVLSTGNRATRMFTKKCWSQDTIEPLWHNSSPTWEDPVYASEFAVEAKTNETGDQASGRFLTGGRYAVGSCSIIDKVRHLFD